MTTHMVAGKMIPQETSDNIPKERAWSPTRLRKGLEALITNSLINNGWLPGDPQDYERAHCVDLRHLSAFLSATQPETAAALALNADSTTRRRFLDRLKREITSRGIIDVLRKGVQHGPNEVTLFYGTPNPGQHPG